MLQNNAVSGWFWHTRGTLVDNVSRVELDITKNGYSLTKLGEKSERDRAVSQTLDRLLK